MREKDGKYSVDHLYILLAQLSRSPSVIDTAMSAKLEGSFLTNKAIGGTVGQAIIFDTLVNHYKEYGSTPDDATLRADIGSFLDTYFAKSKKRKSVEQQIDRFIALRPIVDERSEGLARKIIKYITQICVIRPAARELIDEASDSDDIKGLAERLVELEAKQSSIGGGLSTSGLAGLEFEGAGERVPTHIPWIDAMTTNGAGFVNGSGVGIISPQNGGKTTMGIHLGVNQALAQNHVLVVLAEEGMTQSMRNKILGCALGVDYTLFENNKITEVIKSQGLDPEHAALKLANIDHYMHVLDMVGHNLVPEGMDPIRAEIAQLRSAGSRPRYVYVDWAGIIADAVSKRTGRTKEAEIQSLSFEIAQEAGRNNCIIAVSQQMASAVVKRGPFFSPDMYCAADCTMFCAPFKYGMAINKRDPKTNLQLLTWVKSRDDGILGETQIMRLRGELATFEDVSNQWRQMGKRFTHARKGTGDSKVPTE